MNLTSPILSPSPPTVGLSSEIAQQRLAQEGYNELPSTTRRNTLAIALDVAREPMFLLLIVSATIYLILGDLREAAILASSLFGHFWHHDFSGTKNRAGAWKRCAICPARARW